MNKLFLGAIFSPIDVRDYRAVSSVSEENFPKTFELEMPKVKNQGSVGSCVAHSLSTVIEYFNNKQNNDSAEMSVGYIYGNRSTSLHKGEGMITRDALAAIKLYGDVTKKQFPENIEVPLAIEVFQNRSQKLYNEGYPNRISSYYKLKTNSDIKQALLSGCPVIIAMDWYDDMRVNKDGILSTNYFCKTGGHCMVIYGWNEIGWKVQNSWGSWWGKGGRCVIPYNIKIREFWAVNDEIVKDMDIKKPFSSTIGKVIAKLLNFFWELIGGGQ